MGWYFLAICILHPKQLEMAQAERLFYSGKLGREASKNPAKRIDYTKELPKWIKLRKAGATLREIAKASGVCESTVHSRLNKIDASTYKEGHGTFYPYKIKEAKTR